MNHSPKISGLRQYWFVISPDSVGCLGTPFVHYWNPPCGCIQLKNWLRLDSTRTLGWLCLTLHVILGSLSKKTMQIRSSLHGIWVPRRQTPQCKCSSHFCLHHPCWCPIAQSKSHGQAQGLYKGINTGRCDSLVTIHVTVYPERGKNNYLSEQI